MKALRSLVLIPLALFAIGCSDDGTSPPLFISEAQEIETGREVHEQIIQEYALLPRSGNDQLYSYVETIGQEIVVKSRRPDLQHYFYILDADLVNAFAAPGGYIYVTTGLMRNVKSKAELASVLGHEVGHVSAYHGAKAMERSLALSLFGELLLGDSDATREIVNFVVGTYLNTAHSQDQELQADRLGIEFASGASYNPWGIVDFFTWLDALSEDSMFSFMSSHPEPSERITESTTEINGLGIAQDDANYVKDDSSTPYSQIKALLPPEGSGS